MIDRSAFHSLSYGLYLVTAFTSDGKKTGCVANTFQQVASEPPMVSVSLNKENATTKAILETGKYAVSVLDTSATMDLIGLFGFKSSLDVDKFADVQHAICEHQLPQVHAHCTAAFSVEVRERVDVGTHYLFVGSVLEAVMLPGTDPMTYAYYHEVLRGKTPPKAASYVDESASANDAASSADAAAVSGSTEAPASAQEGTSASAGASKGVPKYGWRCKLCGYIEVVDELPDDYTCPICGVGKDMFERVEL